MSAGGYKIRNQSVIHFITFSVVELVDAFTRKQYRDILLDSIKFCQAEKGLKLYAWCIMSNHIHLILAARDNNLSDLLHDFKKFTAKQLVKAISENKQESRKDWMLTIFSEAGKGDSRNSEYQFWRQDNHPVELYSTAFCFQQLNYLHQNSVEAGIVKKAQDYLYSSAKDYFLAKKSGLLDVIFL